MRILYSHTSSYKNDFLDSGSYIMDGIISLNDHILYYEIILLVMVVWMLFGVLNHSYSSSFSLKDFSHGSTLEIIWTLLPGIILIFIALPSFRLLYLLDDILEPSLSIKVIGFQMGGQKFIIHLFSIK
jgi:cytochrome c oxidase subunit 2